MTPLRLLFVVVVLAGCVSAGPSPQPAEPAPTPTSRPLSKSTHWMGSSAEYQAIVRQTFALAEEQLHQVVADKEPGTWAVAVDADETVISNLEYDRELVRKGKDSNAELWDAWVARRAAPPLPGAIEFLQRIHDLGGYVAVVTNRLEEHCPDTVANFRAFDIPFDVILCRQENRQKEPRWELVQTGTASTRLPPLEIVMWIGDNIRDFPSLDQSVRLRGERAFVDFGTLYFMMPNPLYGSWEDNTQE